MRLFAIPAGALHLLLLLSLFSPFSSAQTVAIGIERRAEIVPSYPDLAREVQLASRGEDSAAVWRTATGRIVATMIDANGKPWTTYTPLTQTGRNPRVVAAGHGYLAAWETGRGTQIDVAHIYDDGSKGLEFVPVTEFDLEASSLRLASAGYRALLVWIARKEGRATLYAVVLTAYGERTSRTIAISQDASLSNPSIARAGSNFIVAFQTAHGIETATIDSRSGSVASRLVSTESPAAMTVVSAGSGPVIFYTLARTGETWSIAPGRPAEPPQFVGAGRLLTATPAGLRPVVALSAPDGLVQLVQDARELPVPGARIETAESIAWSGTKLLIASGKTSTDVIAAGLHGETARSALLGFRFTDRYLVDIATAGGVDLIAWSDAIDEKLVGYAFGRFRDTVALDGGGVHTIWNPAVASDGVSAFLVSGARASGSVAAVAQIVSVDGEPSAMIELGEGRVLDAIWDGTDFIVFREFSGAIHATRIRLDGTILSPDGGAVLARAENINWLQAAPSSAGFVLAYTRDTRTRVAAFTHAFTNIRAMNTVLVRPEEEHHAISLAGNGAGRVLVGIESKLGEGKPVSRRTLMLNERGEQQWSAQEAPSATVSLGNAFVLFFPHDDYRRTVDAVLWDGSERPPDVSAGATRAKFETLTSISPLLTATSPQRTIVAYARLAILPSGDIVRRLITRTVSVLPKEQSPP